MPKALVPVAVVCIVASGQHSSPSLRLLSRFHASHTSTSVPHSDSAFDSWSSSTDQSRAGAGMCSVGRFSLHKRSAPVFPSYLRPPPNINCHRRANGPYPAFTASSWCFYQLGGLRQCLLFGRHSTRRRAGAVPTARSDTRSICGILANNEALTDKGCSFCCSTMMGMSPVIACWRLAILLPHIHRCSGQWTSVWSS